MVQVLEHHAQFGVHVRNALVLDEAIQQRMRAAAVFDGHESDHLLVSLLGRTLVFLPAWNFLASFPSPSLAPPQFWHVQYCYRTLSGIRWDCG